MKNRKTTGERPTEFTYLLLEYRVSLYSNKVIIVSLLLCLIYKLNVVIGMHAQEKNDQDSEAL